MKPFKDVLSPVICVGTLFRRPLRYLSLATAKTRSKLQLRLCPIAFGFSHLVSIRPGVSGSIRLPWTYFSLSDHTHSRRTAWIHSMSSLLLLADGYSQAAPRLSSCSSDPPRILCHLTLLKIANGRSRSTDDVFHLVVNVYSTHLVSDNRTLYHTSASFPRLYSTPQFPFQQ